MADVPTCVWMGPEVCMYPFDKEKKSPELAENSNFSQSFGLRERYKKMCKAVLFILDGHKVKS